MYGKPQGPREANHHTKRGNTSDATRNGQDQSTVVSGILPEGELFRVTFQRSTSQICGKWKESQGGTGQVLNLFTLDFGTRP